MLIAILRRSWEIGTSGTQHVTVVAIDRADRTIGLQRVGTSQVDLGNARDIDSPWPLQPDQRSLAVTIATV